MELWKCLGLNFCFLIDVNNVVIWFWNGID